MIKQLIGGIPSKDKRDESTIIRSLKISRRWPRDRTLATNILCCGHMSSSSSCAARRSAHCFSNAYWLLTANPLFLIREDITTSRPYSPGIVSIGHAHLPTRGHIRPSHPPHNASRIHKPYSLLASRSIEFKQSVFMLVLLYIMRLRNFTTHFSSENHCSTCHVVLV